MLINQIQLPMENNHILYGFERILTISCATLLFLPGFCQTKTGSYFMFTELLKYNENLTGFAFDYRGHGDSTGDLVDVTCSSLLEDGKQMLSYVKKKKLQEKLFLVGSCLGADIALELAIDECVDGVILIGPFLENQNHLEQVVSSEIFQHFKQAGVMDSDEFGKWEEDKHLNEYFVALGNHANRVRGQMFSFEFFESLNKLNSLKILPELKKHVRIYRTGRNDSIIGLSEGIVEVHENADPLFINPKWRDYIYEDINNWICNLIKGGIK